MAEVDTADALQSQIEDGDDMSRTMLASALAVVETA